MANYMSGEERAAQEEAELQAAEREFNGEQMDPQAQPQDTPQAPVEEPQEPAVDWEKRYKDLQSHHDKQLNELRDQLKEAGVVPEETDKVAELQEQLAALQAKEAERETNDLVSQAQATVGNAHPDFVSVINSPEFSQWIQGQPQVYQDAIYADRPDATLAIDALTLFKVQSGHLNKQAAVTQQAQAEQAAFNVGGGHREAPQSNTEKVWTWGEIQSLSPREYDKLEVEIDKAIRDGRVR